MRLTGPPVQQTKENHMHVGLSCVGPGAGCTSPEFITTAAIEAERHGFTSLWFGEHVVLFEEYPRSDYPYKGLFGGDVPITDPELPLIEPVVAMTWAAAATTKLRIGSSIIILPQRNPVILAKQIASLDTLSKGRIDLGVGVGWCREEYDAVGVPWEGRGRRTDEYIEAMRALWSNGSATYHGEFLSFDRTYCFPKPVHGAGLPLIVGGETPAALKRAATYGDAWITFSTTTANVAERVGRLRQFLQGAGRDEQAVKVNICVFADTPLDDLKRYRDAGAHEFTLVVAGSLPTGESQLRSRIAELGERFVGAAAGLSPR